MPEESSIKERPKIGFFKHFFLNNRERKTCRHGQKVAPFHLWNEETLEIYHCEVWAPQGELLDRNPLFFALGCMLRMPQDQSTSDTNGMSFCIRISLGGKNGD